MLCGCHVVRRARRRAFPGSGKQDWIVGQWIEVSLSYLLTSPWELAHRLRQEATGAIIVKSADLSNPRYNPETRREPSARDGMRDSMHSSTRRHDVKIVRTVILAFVLLGIPLVLLAVSQPHRVFLPFAANMPSLTPTRTSTPTATRTFTPRPPDPPTDVPTLTPSATPTLPATATRTWAATSSPTQGASPTCTSVPVASLTPTRRG